VTSDGTTAAGTPSAATAPAATAPAGVPFWAVPVDDLLRAVGGGRDGLTSDEAARRLREQGPNEIRPRAHHRGWRLLLEQFTNPIMGILVVATIISMVLGDVTDGVIILAIIAASGVLGFWQENDAGRAVDALLERVEVHADTVRDGREVEVPLGEIVPGDVVLLRAGDVVPGDAAILESHSLSVDESALSGESFPAEKTPGTAPADAPLGRRSNAVFLGTHVVSGTATVVVVATGRATQFGVVAAELAGRSPTTRFERGLTAFGGLLVRAMVVLVTAIFIVNVVLHRPVIDSLLFSLALAVGLTPQLLPAIVSISLSTGAREMATKKVIVKRLDAIEDFGAMTIFCTDKTGTLTEGAARFDDGLDLGGRPSAEVRHLARVNAALQRGFTNPLDAALLRGAEPMVEVRLDEVPYDFERRRVSVLVDGPTPRLITKGAFAEVLAICTTAASDAGVVPVASVSDDVSALFGRLCQEGSRVLAIATRDLPTRTTATAEDETQTTLVGLRVFADTPKPDAADAVRRLAALGVSIRVITGDNASAARHVARAVGLSTDAPLTGAELERIGDADLPARVARTLVFAEIDPLQKKRIVRAFRDAGETVGFLGDGINDAAALHAADVGISVDTAVDVAKQTAAIVLLEKDLGVVVDGVRLGRKTFANTLKYVRVTTSANFGNMLSMAAASVFLPFLPLLPRQILLLNFLSDVPGMTIAADDVDAEQLERPRAWDIASIRRFMIIFGALSSVFDVATFVVLRVGFGAGPALFRSSWFLESTATELVVMLVLRSNRPFWRTRPGRGLLWSSAGIAVVTGVIPYSPIAAPLGLVAVPAGIFAFLVGLTVVYAFANDFVKRRTGLAA
jgi:Mg2+-importing ATPase